MAMDARRLAALLALLACSASALRLPTRVSGGSLATCHQLTRSPPVLMMGKKTWSIGNARKKAKKAKMAKQTAASTKGNSAVQGFGITKEKLAKALGEMSAEDAIAYLSGPEPLKAGISAEVVDALRTQIVNAYEAAQRAAAKEAKEKKAAAEAAQRADASSGEGASAAPTGPVDDSEEAMRKWRQYCAQALAAAEQAAAVQGSSVPPRTDADDVPLFKPRDDDVPLFKPKAAPPPTGASSMATDEAKSDDTPSAAPPPSGFEWGDAF